jgi:membrane fusion protein, multidrug efflux system
MSQATATFKDPPVTLESPGVTRRTISSPSLRSRPNRRFILPAAALLLFAAIVSAGLYLLTSTQMYETTDDAFIDGHIINLAPQVAGRVARVLITDNQEVEKGDLLVELDSRDFDAVLRQKQAALESTRAQASAVSASIDQARAHVATLQATIESDQAAAEADRANADKANKDLIRNQDLARQKVISPQDLDAARAVAQSSQSTLQAGLKKVLSDQAQLSEAVAQVKTYLSLHESLLAQIQQSEAAVQTAQLSQSYTQIRAPEDGRVTRKSVEQGAYVQSGQAILGLVPHDLWVTANFKENQLAPIRSGQPVELRVDALPGQQFAGKVDSIQSGSGARFSLLPPENATGNYVKVVQRVPVKIVFTQKPGQQLPLGPGESVVPKIKVREFHWSPLSLFIAGTVFLIGSFAIVRWGRLHRVGSKDAVA